MESADVNLKEKNNNILTYFVSSTIIVLFLFYIDEGYYNFNWMSEAMNWVVFFFYCIFFVLIHLFFSLFIPKSYQGNKGILVSVIVLIVLISFMLMTYIY